MEKTFGSRPVLTDDVKVYTHKERLVVGGKPVHGELERNGIQFSMTFVNRTGRSLLVLTPQGGRFVSPGQTPHPTDGKCYFIQRVTLGANVDVGEAMSYTQDPEAQEFMLEIMNAQQTAQNNPAYSKMYTGNPVELEFRYELDCSGIDGMPDGIKVDGVDYHIYAHTRNDGLKTHFGRKQHAEVIRFIEEDRQGENKATGRVAVYVSDKENDTSPVYVMNQYFDGYIYPTKSANRPPGIHIAQIGHSIDASGTPLRSYKHIKLGEFDKYNVFTLDDIRNARVKDMLKGKSAKDVELLLTKLAIHCAHIPDKVDHKSNAFFDQTFGDGTLGQYMTFVDGCLGLANKFTSFMRK